MNNIGNIYNLTGHEETKKILRWANGSSFLLSYIFAESIINNNFLT